MPRKKLPRKIVAPPNFSGFRPYGCPKRCKGSVDLFYEEYEALRLADFDLLSYEEAALLMEISRATFARIYESASRKIARALVEGKEIRSVYGNVSMNSDWFLCDDCHTRFEDQNRIIENNCPECHSENIHLINADN